MDIFINNNKIHFQPDGGSEWSQVVQRLLTDFIPKDHGIVRIVIDNQERQDLLVETTDFVLDEQIGSIEFFTKDSLSITQDGFSKIVKLIESIKSEIVEAADLFRESKVSEASKKVVRILDAIKPIVNFVNSVGVNFSLQFSDIILNKQKTIQDYITEFTNSLNELIAIQEKKDYIEIADYLEYQFMDLISQWHDIVKVLLAEIEALKAKH